MLTQHARDSLKPSPQDFRRILDTQVQPSPEVIAEAQRIIDNTLKPWPLNQAELTVMEVDSGDFIGSPPGILDACADRSSLRDNSVSAIIFDYCVESKLTPGLCAWANLGRSGMHGTVLKVRR